MMKNKIKNTKRLTFILFLGFAIISVADLFFSSISSALFASFDA